MKIIIWKWQKSNFLIILVWMEVSSADSNSEDNTKNYISEWRKCKMKTESLKSEKKSISEELIYVRTEHMKREVRSIKYGKMTEGITKVENDFTLSFKDPAILISDCTNDRGTSLAYD